jgi:imidazolonepropionase-like amidohydrolase
MTRRAILLALCCLAACQPSGEGVTAIEGAMLLDGSGGKPLTESVILVEAGHITAVGRAGEVEVPSGAVRLNATGKTIIPGLIDAHAMVERWTAPRFLAWGVTTVRDFGGAGDSAVALKNELGLVVTLGPRMFTSGRPIDGDPPSDPRATAVGTGAAARKAVDQIALAGADYVAVSTGVTPALFRPLMEEAVTLRMPVTARPGQMDALTVARAGAVSLEQLAGVVAVAAPDPTPFVRAYERPFAGWTVEETAWGLLDSASVARAARSLAATHVVLVPTLTAHEVLARANDPTVLTRPTMQDVPAAVSEVRDVPGLLRRTGWGPGDFAAFRRARSRQDQFVREFRQAGGVVAAGSGAAGPLLVPGAALHDELEQLVLAGFTPLEAIGAATRHAAQLLRADSLGHVAPGAVADLVVLNSSPVDDIAATRDIAWVMTRGRIVYPDSLRSGWRR